MLGPVTCASGRETVGEVASLTDRGALTVAGEASWCQISGTSSTSTKPGECLLLLVSLFTTILFLEPSIIQSILVQKSPLSVEMVNKGGKFVSVCGLLM